MRYIFGVLGTLLVLVFVFAMIFSKGNSPEQAATPTQQAKTLIDYAQQNSTVTLTTVGRVVGVEEQRSVRVAVTPSERRLEIMSGFGETVLSTQSFGNTQVGYESFLAALGGQGFLSSRKTSITDPRSHCPTGQRYEYKLSEADSVVSDLWSVSCDKAGTFAGRTSVVRTLFNGQIPDYNRLVTDVQL